MPSITDETAIASQHALCDYIKNENTRLLNASKDTLYKQHPCKISTLNDKAATVIITACEDDAYKQMFTLLLKHTWERQELQIIIGFCVLI
jgi:hypothetical protein